MNKALYLILLFLPFLTGCLLTIKVQNNIGKINEYGRKVKVVSTNETETVVELEYDEKTQMLLFESFFDPCEKRTRQWTLSSKRIEFQYKPESYLIMIDDAAPSIGRFENGLWFYDDGDLRGVCWQLTSKGFPMEGVPNPDVYNRMTSVEYDAFVKRPFVKRESYRAHHNAGKLSCTGRIKEIKPNLYWVTLGWNMGGGQTVPFHPTESPRSMPPVHGYVQAHSKSDGAQCSRTLHELFARPLDFVLFPIEIFFTDLAHIH